MRVKEYFEQMNPYDDATFIKARARKDANTPFFHPEYQTTPICPVIDWQSNEKILNSIVLNDKQMPIDWLSGALWGNAVKSGHLKCLLIISENDFEMLYKNKDQRDSMEHFIEEQLHK
jgi:hypothetical protein